MANQKSLSKQLKTANTTKSNDIGKHPKIKNNTEKLGRFITTHNEKINGMTGSIKKVKESQDSLDQRFSATYKSIENIRTATLDDIKLFKTYMNKDFTKINDECKYMIYWW